MNSRLLIAGVLGLAGLSAAVRADDMPVVVELFTSQGCSSCPAADEVLLGLASRSEVVALALHVDYWDYIGWADRFADPAFSLRQKAYARMAGAHMVYTPQMIVGGLESVKGGDAVEVMGAVGALAVGPDLVSLSFTREGGTFHISAEPVGAGPGPVLVQLVRFIPQEVVTIERGENAGRTVTYANIVTSWQVLGEWTGTGPLDLETAAAGQEGAALVLQRPGPGAIVGAAILR